MLLTKFKLPYLNVFENWMSKIWKIKIKMIYAYFLKLRHLFKINWIFIFEIRLPNEIHEIKKNHYQIVSKIYIYFLCTPTYPIPYPIKCISCSHHLNYDGCHLCNYLCI